MPADFLLYSILWDRRGRHRMVVRFTTTQQSLSIITKVVTSNPANGEVYSIQHCVIKFDSALRHVSGFFRFPPPIKLTATI
jgi:hypothetical protein